MAKTQLKNYVFKPGIGALGNVNPSAYDLLLRNKDFLIAESIEYINQEIIDANKCQRDTGYIIDGLIADLKCQSTYYSYFIGLAEFNSLDISNTVVRTIQRVQTDAKARAATHYTGTELTTLNAEIDFYCNEVIDIAQNGRTAADLPTYSTVGVATDRVNAAVQVLQNFYFLAAEVNAWVDVTYPSHNHDVAKCSRDVIYALAAVTFDILYTGNTASYDSAKFFNNYSSSGATGITSAHKAQTVAAYRYLQSIIDDIITATPITKSAGNTLSQNVSNPPSTPALGLEASNLIDIVADVVETGLGALPTKVAYSGVDPFADLTSDLVTNKASIVSAITWDPAYTYNSAKCQRDLGYVLDAYLYDLRYGGNSETRRVIHYYWDQTVAQVDGNRIPEIDTHAFIGDLITDYIFTNTAYSNEGAVTQTIDLTKTAEPAAISKIDTLVSNTVAVISNGLPSLPALEPTGVGTIKIQGKYGAYELLLITNSTKSEVIYNFTNATTGASISIKDHGEDDEFPTYLQTTDGVTTLTLNYDTSAHSETDELQIFVEEKEVRIRPYDFGTDAIERMRIAPPMSMLDADFEYGLQPTKWSAIGTLRGYPSVYELPGTDTQVVSVVTDASAGTNGIGQSLITVTTPSPHGFEPGTPITIKAFENSINGAARAEGAFIIINTPTSNTFTYYAKAKVGTTNGQVISTNYTQLREAGFYTGAAIGSPTFVIASNGSAGTMTTELAVLAGQDIIPFDGDAPEIGSPIDDVSGAVPLGSQVTSIRSTSAGGGTFLNVQVLGDYNIGATTITVADATGVEPGLAVNSGNGYATYVSNVVGNDISFTLPTTDNIKGNTSTYTVTGETVAGIGSEATFNISRAAGVYTVDSIVDDGLDYEIGDRILISGEELGGVSPDHDLTLVVDSTFSNGAISSVLVEGTAFDGVATITGFQPPANGGIGYGAYVDVDIVNNVFSSVTLTTEENYDFAVNDRIIVTGDNFGSNGVAGTNDLIVTVTSVDSEGTILTTTVAGTAPDSSKSFYDPTWSTNNLGTAAFFQVVKNGTAYTVNFINPGFDFIPTDVITVLGSELEGIDTTNDLTITVDNVDGSGRITNFTVSGLATNIDQYLNVIADPLIGTSAAFSVTLNAGSYNVAVTSLGQNYGINQTFTILGSLLYGEDVTNDLEITITSTNATGGILAVSATGTAVLGTGSYTNISGTNEIPQGNGGQFTIVRTNGTYQSIVLENEGTNYGAGNRIIIPGDNLGGISPLNDILIKVTTVTVGTDGIDTFTSEFVEASPGVNFDLISTFTITEVTTNPLPADSELTFSALATIEVEFTNAHGLVPGDSFITAITSDDGSNGHILAAGSYFATEIPALNSLRYQVRAPGNIDESTTVISGTVYARPDSFFIHRPYDGGVQLGTGGPQHGAQAIRQSKKYIRYQSGKGIMYTTGALFAPSYDLRSVTADGTEVGALITVETDDNDHGVQVGGIIRLLGVETPGYNSGNDTAVPPNFDYEVVDVVNERVFKVRSQRRLGSTNAVLGFAAQMSVVSWHGATVRSGVFDDQNGIFWEYDGTNISVNQRTGTKQLSGTISLEVDDNLITGTNTRFRDQAKAGDRIVIKGMTHVISHVDSDTSMTVTPDWRGVVDITGTKANLVVDKKVKQQDFNLDRLDGTGPSGYNIDIAKMQMIGIQYSWYGAGFIDFMLRGSDGNFVFCHRMRNSNINTEAFMRSGNLPVRYEVTNEGPPGQLAETIDAVQTTIELVDGQFFPTSGTIYIDNEIINFSGRTGNTLTGCVRNADFVNFQAGAERTYNAGVAESHLARTGVILISNTITPLISHWGSAFLTDGGFDEDRGYIFSYAETGLTISTTKQTAFMIRLAPSVSNAIVGDLGERELLNRAQLLLQGLEITSETGTGGIVVEGVLNPNNFPLDPGTVTWSGLASQAQGGQPSFAQIANGGSITWASGAAAVTATPATAAFPSGTITLTDWYWVGGTQYSTDGQAQVLLNDDDYRNYIDSGLSTGDYFTHPNFPANTTVTGFSSRWTNGGNRYRWMYLSSNSSGNASQQSATVQKRYKTSSTSVIWFNSASLAAAGVTSGTSVSDSRFPAGTQVNTINLDSYFGNSYSIVSFNNTSNATVINPGTTTIEFSFIEPPYAQPGETVFSYIANPGERSTLDLNQLKELTNTPLGGRGTFPNGPDVLAINVYKVSGSDLTGNIILRWGEAQA